MRVESNVRLQYARSANEYVCACVREKDARDINPRILLAIVRAEDFYDGRGDNYATQIKICPRYSSLRLRCVYARAASAGCRE